MNNEIKHYNHNHGKDGRFTFGAGVNTSFSKSHNSTVKDIDGRPVGEEKPVKSKKGLLHESSKIFFDPERYEISNVEGPNDYAGFLQYSSNSPALKKKFPHLTQNKNTTGMIFVRSESANNPTGVLHIKRDKNGENKIDFLWTHGNKKDDTKQLYPYELFDIAHNVYGVKSGNKPGEIPLVPEVSEYVDGITNKKKIHEDYTQSFNAELIKNNTNKNGEFEYGLSARKDKRMNKTNYIQHGRGPNKHHKYIKIENGKYIYPKDLVNKITKIRDKVDAEKAKKNKKDALELIKNKNILNDSKKKLKKIKFKKIEPTRKERIVNIVSTPGRYIKNKNRIRAEKKEKEQYSRLERLGRIGRKQMNALSKGYFGKSMDDEIKEYKKFDKEINKRSREIQKESREFDKQWNEKSDFDKEFERRDKIMQKKMRKSGLLKRRRNYIKHGRGPSKRHKYIKIENGRYIYPENLINKDAVNSIVKRANNESRIRQKNGGYAVPKNPIERRAENITRINQRNGKFTNHKKNNNAVGTIANAARNARRNTVRPNNYGHDRTTNYGRPKMNTASNAAERAFNSMNMSKVRKVKKSKLSEFKKKLKRK